MRVYSMVVGVSTGEPETKDTAQLTAASRRETCTMIKRGESEMTKYC